MKLVFRGVGDVAGIADGRANTGGDVMVMIKLHIFHFVSLIKGTTFLKRFTTE